MIPDELHYTAEHEWIRVEHGGDDGGEAGGDDGGVVTIGVTDYAQDALGDIVYVSLPEVGETVTQGSSVGELESTKSVSDLYAPLSGSIVARNEAVESAPDLVNSDPYGEGWLLRLEVEDRASIDALLDAAGYRARIES